MRLRSLHMLLGNACAALAGVAMVRLGDGWVAIMGVGLAMVAYHTSRVVPDARLALGAAGKAASIGVVIILAGLIADLQGGDVALTWPGIVLAYCAGNRWKAAGLGSVRPD